MTNVPEEIEDFVQYEPSVDADTLNDLMEQLHEHR